MGSVGQDRLRLAILPLALCAPMLLAGALLPQRIGWPLSAAAIILAGVPHGALDLEIGRGLLKARLGLAWFLVFSLPYLGLAAVVLLAWRLAPLATLGGFLALSVWHFGSEETGEAGFSTLVLGGLPIAVPVLAQPAATARLLSAIAGIDLPVIPPWLDAACWVWTVPALVWVVLQVRHPLRLVLPAGLAAGFVVLPPLCAFGLYFIGVHAPTHTATLIRDPARAPRVVSIATAWRYALPSTALTIALAAALWPLYSAPPPVRIVTLTLQVLAALTLPHMLLEAALGSERTTATAGIRSGLRGGTDVRRTQPYPSLRAAVAASSSMSRSRSISVRISSST